MKNIKVKRLDDSNSVNVRIEHTAKMAPTVDELKELTNGDFRNVIRLAKKYRRANRSMSKFVDNEGLQISINSDDDYSAIVNDLVDLGNDEFRKAIKCAKQCRKANRMLDIAVGHYTKLAREDKERIANGRLAYEAS